MTNTKHSIISATFLILVSGIQAQIVRNGSFESGSDPGTSAELTSVDSSSINHWIVDSGTIDYIGTRWTAGDGSRCLDLTGSSAGSVKQTLSCLVTGETYRLTFLMAGNPEIGGAKNLRVHIGNSSQDFSFDSSGKSTSNLGWITNTIDFTPLASSVDLRFQSLNSGLAGPAVDRVAVVHVTAHEWIANGSFESGSNPGISTQVDSVDSSSITAWTVDTGNIDYIGTRWTAGDGSRCLDLSGTDIGSVKQTLSCLVTGTTYRLTFLIAANPEVSGAKNMRVEIGNATNYFSVNSTGNTSDLGWVTNTIDFTPLTSSLDVRFISRNSGYAGPALDRVSVKNQ
ncbi:MAG TPA: choice-of-anchor C family protein [Verrucomicrobiae bacterium]